MNAGLTLLIVIVAAIAVAWVAVRRDRVGRKLPVAVATVRDDDVADTQVLAQLRAAGADLTKPTQIRYSLYVPTRAQAEQAAAELAARGFVPELRPPAGLQAGGAIDTEWAVIAVETHVPSPEHVRVARAIFSRLATTFGGVYDGWEAAVTP
ncbi:MAG: ribonuclease E inhibitor RraB [Vulcanimicrobiaceae bacterium]|jgi:hypothetical protein